MLRTIFILLMFFILGFFSHCLFSIDTINSLKEEIRQLKIKNNRKDQVLNFYKSEIKESTEIKQNKSQSKKKQN